MAEARTAALNVDFLAALPCLWTESGHKRVVLGDRTLEELIPFVI
jgi:hypothetical protein